MGKEIEEEATVAVGLSKLLDLAVNTWRLERWLAQTRTGPPQAALRYVARANSDLLRQLELETLDLTGRPFEPGLAIEVVGTVIDAALPPETVLVEEMVAPVCLWKGKVVRHGQVVTRSSARSSEGDAQ